MSTDAPTPDDVAAIRARHTPWRDHRGRTACAECAHSWPCDAARLLERIDAAECRVETKDGRTLVVTAAEMREAWEEARGLYERAQCWAAGWRRAAYDRRARSRESGTDQRALLADYDQAIWELTEAAGWERRSHVAAAVVEAARALDLAGVGGPARALREALAAYDAAREATAGPAASREG